MAKKRSDIIFQSPIGPYSITQINRVTGIPERTLYAYRADPDSIPAGKLRLLFKAVKLPPEKVIEFFK